MTGEERAGGGAAGRLVRRMASNSMVYGLGAVGQKALVFLLVPIYTRVLLPREYGIVAVVDALVPLFALVYGFALRGALVRHYHALKEDPERLGEYLSSITVGGAALASAAAVLTLLAVEPFYGLMGLDFPFSPHFLLIVLTALLFAVSDVVSGKLLAEERALYFVGFTNGRQAVTAVVAVALVVGLERGPLGHVEGKLVGAAVALLLLAPALRNVGELRVRAADLKRALSFSLPLVPHMAAAWALTGVDRLLLASLGTEAQAGVYDVGYKIAMLTHLAIAAVGKAWGPAYFDLAERDDDAPERLGRALSAMLGLVLLVAVATILFGDTLVAVVGGDRYRDAARVVPFVASAFVAYAVYAFFNSAIYFQEKTSRITALSLSALVINVGLNVLLIPPYGIVGAAVATLAAYLVLGAAGYVLSQRAYRVRFPPRQFGLVAALVGGAVGLEVATGGLSSVWAASVRAAGLAAAGALVARWLVPPGGLSLLTELVRSAARR